MTKPRIGSLWLASKSARRAQLLDQAGFDATLMPASIDDGELSPGCGAPEGWVMALAYLKARNVADALREQGECSGLVLGADTVCVHNGMIIGQPADDGHAQEILAQMRRDDHDVLTGICMIDLSTSERTIIFDRATVRMGDITDAQIAAHLECGAWRGKAGAYNYDDQVAVGWDLDCLGDTTTVTGLPMKRLETLLPQFGACD